MSVEFFDSISKIITDRSAVHGTCYGTIFLIDVDVRIPEVKNKLEEAVFRGPSFDEPRRHQRNSGTARHKNAEEAGTQTKVLMNHIHYGGFRIENPADAFQFPGLRMIDSRIHRRQLFFTLFAHFAAAPFFYFSALSIGWTLSTRADKTS